MRSSERRGRRPGPGTTAADDRPDTAFYIFCLYTFILVGRPQDYVSFLVPFRLALVFTAVAVAVTLSARRQGPGPLGRFETKLYHFFFAVMCAGIPFSIYRRASFDFLMLGYIVNVVYFTLFLIHVNTAARLRQTAFVLFLSMLAFTLASLAQGRFVDGRFFTGSDMFDPNDVAFVELALIPFGLFVFLRSQRLVAKLLTATGLSLSVLLILYTGSRGGLLGLAAMSLLFLAMRTPGVRASHKVLVLLLAGVLVAANAHKIDIKRYMTLTDVQDDYNLNGEFGRAQVWRRGLDLFLAQPLTGVGVSNFGAAIGTMRAAEDVLPRWQAAHNSYVEVMTETGVFGIMAFVLLVLVSLKTFVKLRRSDRWPSDTGLDVLATTLAAGYFGQMVSAFFLSQAYSMFFTLSFACSASLGQLASRAEELGQVVGASSVRRTARHRTGALTGRTAWSRR